MLLIYGSSSSDSVSDTEDDDGTSVFSDDIKL